MKRYGIFLLLALLAPLLLGSRCGDQRIEGGELRDTIFSVERHYNGYYSVWFTHDDIVGYCTNNQELGESALMLLREHDGEVVATYRDIRGMSDEEANFWSGSECGSISTGAESSTETMILTSLVRVSPR